MLVSTLRIDPTALPVRAVGRLLYSRTLRQCNARR
jgi:hypothetical protein